MKNNSFGGKILIVVIIIGILYIIGSAVDASKSKCVKSGCNNERSSGSAYCFCINHMKIHRTRTHIAAPQEPRQKVRLKLRQRQLREQLPVLLQEKNRQLELGRITIHIKIIHLAIHTSHTMMDMMMCIWMGIMMMIDIIAIRITLMVWMML